MCTHHWECEFISLVSSRRQVRIIITLCSCPISIHSCCQEGLWKHGYSICHVTDFMSRCSSFSNASVLISVLNLKSMLFPVSGPESSLVKDPHLLLPYRLTTWKTKQAHPKDSEKKPKKQRTFKTDLSFSKCTTSRVLDQYDYSGEEIFALLQNSVWC